MRVVPLLLLSIVGIINGADEATSPIDYKKIGLQLVKDENFLVELETSKHSSFIATSDEDNYYSDFFYMKDLTGALSNGKNKKRKSRDTSDKNDPWDDPVFFNQAITSWVKYQQLTDGGTKPLETDAYTYGTETVPRKIEVLNPRGDELNLSNLMITTIDPAAFKNVTHIKKLNLSNNRLRKLLPNSLSSFKNLEYLDLSKNDQIEMFR